MLLRISDTVKLFKVDTWPEMPELGPLVIKSNTLSYVAVLRIPAAPKLCGPKLAVSLYAPFLFRFTLATLHNYAT